VSGDELRSLMRRFPHGVAVVTVESGHAPLGLTLSSFVSLSLEPPLVGFAVSRQAALHELLREAGRFGVSLLAEGQGELAAHFARGVPPIALWTGVPVREAAGPPELEGALGWVAGRVVAEHPAGTHTFFVGQLDRAELGPATRPLVRWDGSYVAL
jgi:flavin reductase (DIM6/NTAB) family NADH-FMN oxidoreductase RutF